MHTNQKYICAFYFQKILSVINMNHGIKEQWLKLQYSKTMALIISTILIL